MRRLLKFGAGTLIITLVSCSYELLILHVDVWQVARFYVGMLLIFAGVLGAIGEIRRQTHDEKAG